MLTRQEEEIVKLVRAELIERASAPPPSHGPVTLTAYDNKPVTLYPSPAERLMDERARLAELLALTAPQTAESLYATQPAVRAAVAHWRHLAAPTLCERCFVEACFGGASPSSRAACDRHRGANP